MIQNGEPVKRFLYAEISNAGYSISKSPHWKTGTALTATVILAPIGFRQLSHQSGKHWFTVAGEHELVRMLGTGGEGIDRFLLLLISEYFGTAQSISPASSPLNKGRIQPRLACE